MKRDNENVIHFSVSGEGKFPVYLLSKSKCFPETTSDSKSIFSSYKKRTINLVTYSDVPISSWILEGWNVRCKGSRIYQEDDYNLYHTWPC